MSVDLDSLVEPDVATVEGRTKVVEIEDIEPSVLKEMLRYLYTGRAPKNGRRRNDRAVFLAAIKYQIKGLMDLCEQSLISALNIQKVVQYLVLAHLHSALQLLEASFKFLVSHKTEMWTRPEWKGTEQELYRSFLFSFSPNGCLNFA